MIPLTTLYDYYIDRPKLTDQKNPFEYIVPPPSERGRNKNVWKISFKEVFSVLLPVITVQKKITAIKITQSEAFEFQLIIVLNFFKLFLIPYCDCSLRRSGRAPFYHFLGNLLLSMYNTCQANLFYCSNTFFKIYLVESFQPSLFFSSSKDKIGHRESSPVTKS